MLFAKASFPMLLEKTVVPFLSKLKKHKQVP